MVHKLRKGDWVDFSFEGLNYTGEITDTVKPKKRRLGPRMRQIIERNNAVGLARVFAPVPEEKRQYQVRPFFHEGKNIVDTVRSEYFKAEQLKYNKAQSQWMRGVGPASRTIKRLSEKYES